MKIHALKQELKDLAVSIKTSKHAYKEAQRAGQYTICSSLQPDLKNLPYTYRHRHIAYCLLRGKQYEKVELKVKEGNEPNWPLIYSIMNQFRDSDPISCGDSAI
jgi:hypothetical protein